MLHSPALEKGQQIMTCSQIQPACFCKQVLQNKIMPIHLCYFLYLLLLLQKQQS